MADPLCKYFGRCNGCNWQNIDYSAQLEKKKSILAGTINFNDIEIFSDNPYFYRNRLDMIFHGNGMGLRGRNEVIFVDECIISSKRVNSLIKEMNDFFRNNDKATLCSAVLRGNAEISSVSFFLNEKSSRLGEAIEKIKEFSEKTSANSVAVSYINPQDEKVSNFFITKGEGVLKENLMGKEFSYSSEGFFQNNSKVAEKMQEYVNKILKEKDAKNACLVDLYGGVGTFGVINSELFKETIIIESDKRCIETAEINIKKNNSQNAKAICLDAKNFERVKLPKDIFLITDPPRSGMDIKTIKHISQIRPKCILYISCNIEQLGKDLKKLNNYEIRRAALFDLFPQTSHIEAIVELIPRQ